MAQHSEFRRSQGVVPFGVGSTIDFKDESLMMAGLDVWPSESGSADARALITRACSVFDGRLADRLSTELERPIRYFLTPAEAPERYRRGAAPRIERQAMPFVRFPGMYFCPRCRVLKKLPWNAQSRGDALRCSNTGRRTEGKGAPCGTLSIKRRPKLSPVRFVVACEDGHIMDFPWNAWAHKESDRVCNPGPSDLYLYSTPAAGLAGVRVGCVVCGISNSMAGAFRRDALVEIFGNKCPGHRPWLGPDSNEDCSKIPQTIQRGASNAYFAKVVSSILIPPYSARMRQVLDRPDVWEEILASPLVEGKPHEPLLRVKAKNLGLDPDTFIKAVSERLGIQLSSKETSEFTSEDRYRFEEFGAYLGPRPPQQERHDFDTESFDSHHYGSEFASLFEKVVLVRKLRETRALTGFSRIMPPQALIGTLAELSVVPKKWLPGFSVRGEGIFLKFNKSALEKWNQNFTVVKRIKKILERLSSLHKSRGTTERQISATTVLVHTFSHLLIRQMAFECGYDSSSIRERLYVSSDPLCEMAGLLLYTASGDSEGTLGGLVRQGEPNRLSATVRAAVKNAAICSSDPLCIESDGQGLFSLNLAACHACSLLPETSCEEGNLLLDRALVIGTPNDPGLGYFRDFLS